MSSVLFGSNHLLSLLTLGTNTGLVMDLGYSETLVIPVSFKILPVIPLSGNLEKVRFVVFS